MRAPVRVRGVDSEDREGRLAVSWERELHPGPVNCSQPKPVEASPFHIRSSPVESSRQSHANGTKVCFYLHISIFPLAVNGIGTTYFFNHKWTFTRPKYFLQWRYFKKPPQFHPSFTVATSNFDFSAQLIVILVRKKVWTDLFLYSWRYHPLYLLRINSTVNWWNFQASAYQIYLLYASRIHICRGEPECSIRICTIFIWSYFQALFSFFLFFFQVFVVYHNCIIFIVSIINIKII